MKQEGILILGSQGFIGSNLVTFFLSKGYHVTGCDLVEFSTTRFVYHKLSIMSADFDTIFATQNYSICINAAGSGNVSYSLHHTYSDFEFNSIAVAKLLSEFARYQPLCKYIHLSSAAVYGNSNSLPIGEERIAAPISPYGYHKLIAETICREYYHLYDLQVVVIRPFSVYGDGLRKQILWDLCCKLNESDEVNLFGSGNESRDFISIKDLASLIELLIGSGNFACAIYNAGSGIETSIKEISNLVLKYFPGNKRISFNGRIKAGDPDNWRANISKIKELGYTQSISLEEGIGNYVNWFLKNYSA